MDPNVLDYDLRCPLHTACAAGHKQIVKMLIGDGANPKCVDRWGNEPLMDAINENHTDVVRYIECSLNVP